jgi:uncharacterized protein (TIGR03545 family)
MTGTPEAPGTAQEPPKKRSKIFRWRAIVPLVLLVILLVVGWILLLDTLVERGVEKAATAIVGAKVDVEEADVQLDEGAVVLRGLQVTNPDQPMKNLFEAREIVANLRVGPLLEKKVVVETLAVRDVRFGTDRTESGAIDNPSPESRRLWREVNAWADQIRIPPFSLEGIGRAVVNVDAISPDSLATLAHARAAVALADSMRTTWEQRIQALDPRPQIDSAQALVVRLQNANPAQLGIQGVTQLVTTSRSTLENVTQLKDRIASLDDQVRDGVGDLRSYVQEFEATKDADLAYARRLLNIPSLDAPSVSPALFGETAVAWLKPVLYWVKAAEEYLPPGLDPRRRSGPKRARASGTTVQFPGRATYPKFLLEHGEAQLAIGGEGVAAGNYAALLQGLSSAPAMTGPMRIFAERTEAAEGPRQLRLSALLDHGQQPIRDSVALFLAGVSLPSVDLGAFGGTLNLGTGTSDFSLARNGDQIAARLFWSSRSIQWERSAAEAAAAANAEIGSTAWAKDLLWRTLAGLNQVDVDMKLSGSLDRPAVSVSTNIAQAIAQSLRRALGEEIDRAEQRIRAEVDRLVADGVQRAQAAVSQLIAELPPEVAAFNTEIGQVEQLLQDEIGKLTRLPGGIRLPGGR